MVDILTQITAEATAIQLTSTAPILDTEEGMRKFILALAARVQTLEAIINPTP